MKLCMKPVEMIAVSTCDGSIRPLKFKWHEANDTAEAQVVKVDRIYTISEEKIAGNSMLVFSAQSFIHGEDRRYELKYEKKSMIWYLSRI